MRVGPRNRGYRRCRRAFRLHNPLTLFHGVELRGTRSNRQGIGAEIVLVSESGKRQYNVCTTAGSYFSASDRRVFFGLGQEKGVKEIRIRWPGGGEQVVPNPAPDQVLKVTEETRGNR